MNPIEKIEDTKIFNFQPTLYLELAGKPLF